MGFQIYRGVWRLFSWRWIAAAWFFCGFTTPAAESTKEEKLKPVKVTIRGYGVLGNRELKRLLKSLQENELKKPVVDASFVEDSALILMARLQRDGHLHPVILANLVLQDGRKLGMRWQDAIEPPLQRPLAVKEVSFTLLEGIIYHLKDLHFEGLTLIPEKKARSFFLETGTLLKLKKNRIYTPARVERGVGNLTQTLERQGYASARATATNIVVNDKSGVVSMVIRVHEGEKSIVRTIRKEIYDEATNAATTLIHTNVPFSRLWQQDFSQALRATNYQRGYPDTSVELTVTNRQQQGTNIELHMVAKVLSGPLVRLGNVRFIGAKKSKPGFLSRMARLDEGSLLDRVQVEQGRYRLARLGVFRSVDVDYRPVSPEVRDVVYRITEGKNIDVSLLFGYGSYEMLRGGVDVEQYNIFGRGHRAHFRGVQSFKASVVDYTYNMPEFLARDLDLFFNGSWLRREEVSFTREEFGGGVGVRRFFKAIQSDLSVRYSYQVLSADERDGSFEAIGVRDPTVGSFITDLRHDRRDNPIYPARGYKVFVNLELASEALAGDVDYQRMEVATSLHQPLGEGRWLHVGLTHGFISTMGSASEDLPFNRRFFPGGQNSIRGYQEGEASPRNARGKFVGAEAFTLANVEFEQAITPKWSLLGFVDGIGLARELSDYPFRTTLVSAGGGLRWKTIIGPVRVEYGHNINPRRGDPSGTLHFSLGFPF